MVMAYSAVKFKDLKSTDRTTLTTAVLIAAFTTANNGSILDLIISLSAKD